MTEEEYEKYNPYCPICEACGEDGCCSAMSCQQHPDGKYCQSYLRDLRMAYMMEKRFYEKIYDNLPEDLKKEYDEIWDREYNLIYKPYMKTKVYSAFPGVGKTTYFKSTDRNVLDSDSSKFDKKNFPANYIEHIERNIQDPNVDKILVSSHKDVRDALVKKGIPFVLVYPDRSLKDEYIQRYKNRGNNDAFVELLEKNWDMWMDEMDNQGDCYRVKLDSGMYLTDVID